MRLTDEQIATELRALRDKPSERFAAELDAWAAEGFPSAKRVKTDVEGARAGLLSRTGARIRRLRERPLLPALAGAASIVLVVGVSIAVLSDRDGARDISRGGDSGVESLGTDEAAPGSAGVAPEQEPSTAIEPAAPTTVQPIPPGRTDQLKPGRERVQERSASMELSTESDQVDDVSDGVVQVTDRYDGIVVSSNVNTSDSQGLASFDLRIPTQNLQAALTELSDLAHVSSRNEGSLDITAPFASAEERFDDAKAEVDSLLDQLADADSPAEVAAIREQLRLARQELAAARAELGALKQRADFSRLSVTVLGDGDGDGWSIGDAADDAVDVLETLGGATLITLAVLLPLSVLGFLIWLGFRQTRQHRRESALDE
jgi:Domain of unknown function (DUF4349)